MSDSVDVVCVGGGVIGLMTAYELAARGVSVALFDKGAIGKEASWAGVGIVPPASLASGVTPYDRLRGYSSERFPLLAERLMTETGLDIGYRNTGGLELAFDAAQASELEAATDLWDQLRIDYETLEPSELREREPGLAPLPLRAYWVPGMSQVRNPRLLRALQSACERLGVRITAGTEVADFERQGDQATAVRMVDGTRIGAATVVVATGAWSAWLLQRAGFEIPVFPVQGQILALGSSGAEVRGLVIAGKRYLIPRDDGLVLVGSTEDEVGFDKQVTDEGIDGLREFALRMFPALGRVRETARWAGLRPGNALGSPIMGRVPGWSNLWLSTGHFREGLQLSPGSGRLLADWITGVEAFATPEQFALDADRSAYRAPFRS